LKDVSANFGDVGPEKEGGAVYTFSFLLAGKREGKKKKRSPVTFNVIFEGKGRASDIPTPYTRKNQEKDRSHIGILELARSQKERKREGGGEAAVLPVRGKNQ